MRFHLVYRGRLSASGNSPKPAEAKRIRDQIHPQLERLWTTDTALKRLRSTAIVAKEPGRFLGSRPSPFEPEYDPSKPIQDGYVDLCEPISQGDYSYMPLVRSTLDTICSLNILFLRNEDPGQLVKQAGDIDNRIKTLFDGLRMPDPYEQQKYPPDRPYTYCLLQSDSLISDLSVSTDRLLIPESDQVNEVHLIIEVRVKVLKLGTWNVCLAGG